MACAIIVAAGEGTRMATDVRKPYLMLEGCPVVGHTLKAFDACDSIERIFLVVKEGDQSFCEQHIIGPLGLSKPICLVPGGSERQGSVFEGLKAVRSAADGIAVVHDGVRPFVTSALISGCIQGARDHGACILAVPSPDSLKVADGQGMIRRSIPRADVWLAQTPQAFRFNIIYRAHEEARRRGRRGTDDAMLVEMAGTTVKIISGSRYNFKITTRDDLNLARAMLRVDTQQREF